MPRDDLRKVLLIGDYPPPLGGIAVHVEQLHGYLRRCGVETKVLDIGKGGRPAPDVLPVHTAVALARELHHFAGEGWLLHLHTNGGNPKSWAVTAAVGTAAALAGTRAVVTLHSGLLPEYLDASAARRAAARAALWPFDRVVAVSQAVSEALLAAGVPPERVAVHPAFLASAVRPGKLPAGFAVARERRSPLIAYAHHPSPVYGRSLLWSALTSAAERHPSLGVAVFGPGSQTPGLWSEARALGIDDRLEVFGELSHDEALALIERSDVFVRPTLADGDAISVREALVLGVPCVASDAASRPAGTITFSSGDADALVAALDEAIARPRRPGDAPDAGPWLVALYRALGVEPQARRWARRERVERSRVFQGVERLAWTVGPGEGSR